MKRTLGFALVAAILIAAQLFTPVSAATQASVAAGDCGDTYVVMSGDYLARIARTCGTTVSNILILNPQIVNPGLIYPGQVIRLDSSVPIPYWPATTTGTSTTTSGTARVSVSSTWVHPGDEVTVYVSGFPADAEIDYRLGVSGAAFSVVYDGSVSSTGTASATVTIPASAGNGEYWVVQVITTGLANAVSVNSHAIYVTTATGVTYYGSPRVSLSATRAVAGTSLTVYVKGFPANAEIDYRLGLRGETYSVVYDGTVASDGTTSATVTIPSSATKGQYWVVTVLTTSLKTVTSVTSYSIYIYE